MWRVEGVGASIPGDEILQKAPKRKLQCVMPLRDACCPFCLRILYAQLRFWGHKRRKIFPVAQNLPAGRRQLTLLNKRRKILENPQLFPLPVPSRSPLLFRAPFTVDIVKRLCFYCFYEQLGAFFKFTTTTQLLWLVGANFLLKIAFSSKQLRYSLRFALFRLRSTSFPLFLLINY